MNTSDSAQRPPTLLIVDDVPDNLRHIVGTLEEQGYRVLVAEDGAEALRRAEFVRPDLVLLDVVMPVLDGFETCRRLKAGDATRDIPVIFMTALTDADAKLSAFAAGGVDYVTKPFDIAEVLARVNTHLTLHATQVRLAVQNVELTRREQERRHLNSVLEERMERLAHLSRRLVMVQEEERRRLATLLHDCVSPNLAVLQINLGFMRGGLAQNESADFEARLADAHALLADITASIREVCTDLRPVVLDYFGLLQALTSYGQQFARRTGIAVEVTGSDGGVRLAPELESALFRIVQEALTNCARHAAARAVTIELRHDAAHASLTIADDGVGFDPDRLADSGRPLGLGLLTMRERAEFAGAKFNLESRPKGGTRITVEI